MSGSLAVVPTQRAMAGFTMLEVILVIMAMALVLTFGVGSFQRSVDSQRLSTATVLLTNELARASQLAVKENRTIYVRFLRKAGPAGVSGEEQYRGWSLVAANRSTGELEPLTEEQNLAAGVIFHNHQDYSNILYHVPKAGPGFPLGFTPEGGTTLPVAVGSRWCLTLVLEADVSTEMNAGDEEASSLNRLPPNHRTLIINAHTGAVTAY